MLRREVRRDADNAAFWDAMEKAADDALQDLADLESQLAPKPDANPFADEGGMEPFFAPDDEQPLVTEATRYGNAAHRWIERRRSELVDGRALLDPMERDATEVILWYRLFIGVKLNRAFFGRRVDEEDEEDGNNDAWEGNEPTPSDADGSAKVAIIGIDRSVTAWAVLTDHRPRDAKTIRPILCGLLRLRGWADREFPNARAFVRPGFDDGTAT